MKNGNTLASELVIPNNIFFEEVKRLLSSGKDVLFTINGNSMHPFLFHSNKVLIGAATDKDLRFGKVILAYSSYGYVLHRIIWKNNTNMWLAGDNNLIQLEKVNRKDVLGYVKYAEIEGEKVDIHTFGSVVLAIVWFMLRPFRLLLFKIGKIFKKI